MKTVKKGKKRTSDILSIRNDDAPGGTVQGIFISLDPMFTMDNEPMLGNFDQHLHTLDLADFETKEITRYWADGGVKGALKLARVKEGDKIIIEHTGKKKIEQGVVQTYEVYEAVL